MKTEIKKAKENIEKFEIEVQTKNTPLNERNCKEHKQACERWLEWIKEYFGVRVEEGSWWEEEKLTEKIQDLKTAIKLYEEAGI